ncbi:type VI secretion system protein ImpH [Singulisphaera sp. GP187]|uniref:type VI secretion system baseplate subunit TssG n=1 Tax=Singulisphaera sp. GP187 TaxID=1882752 RepID=UPI000928814D|nr:type VI secretion system baseplate subunit TssG [Singulisphaera sp. GP187]SIO60711.1 type VI secretion system protein ImpH [Singulisphaera sp. GP187]
MSVLLPESLARQLFAAPYGFDFFQTVRLLHRLDPTRVPVGLWGPPESESVRFRAHVSLGFPPSAIVDLALPGSGPGVPLLTQAFFGLTGPSGVLPRHYTELLFRLESSKEPEHAALREWLDLFNHRLLSLFHRAWEKYRFPVTYERRDWGSGDLDTFSQSLYSLVGLGTPSVRGRLVVSTRVTTEEAKHDVPLARVDDLSLIYYAGLLAHRPRNAIGLEAFVGDYFGLTARVTQHVGQWLALEPDDRTQIGADASHNVLGAGAVVGDRVWDVQSKICIHLGPIGYAQFVEFLPDRDPVAERKAIFLLAQLVRLYIGQDLDFDVRLILRGDEVPDCVLEETQEIGPRLGWNTWLRSEPVTHDCDAVFEGQEVFRLG